MFRFERELRECGPVMKLFGVNIYFVLFVR